MTEIDKLIEEEAEKYVVGKLSRHSEIIDKFSMQIQYFTGEDILEAQRSIKSFILHQNRWRKVEEELPETNVDVLLKFDNGNVSIGVYCKDEFEEYFSCINGDEYSISEVTEWKPIE